MRTAVVDIALVLAVVAEAICVLGLLASAGVTSGCTTPARVMGR